MHYKISNNFSGSLSEKSFTHVQLIMFCEYMAIAVDNTFLVGRLDGVPTTVRLAIFTYHIR